MIMHGLENIHAYRHHENHVVEGVAGLGITTVFRRKDVPPLYTYILDVTFLHVDAPPPVNY